MHKKQCISIASRLQALPLMLARTCGLLCNCVPPPVPVDCIQGVDLTSDHLVYVCRGLLPRAGDQQSIPADSLAPQPLAAAIPHGVLNGSTSDQWQRSSFTQPPRDATGLQHVTAAGMNGMHMHWQSTHEGSVWPESLGQQETVGGPWHHDHHHYHHHERGILDVSALAEIGQQLWMVSATE